MNKEELLNMNVRVYDMKALIEKESGGKYSSFIQDKLALIKDKNSKKFVLVDYEAVGGACNGEKTKYIFDVVETPEPNTIAIFPSGSVKLGLSWFTDKPYTEVPASEFFRKREYKDRCRWHWEALVDSVKDFEI